MLRSTEILLWFLACNWTPNVICGVPHQSEYDLRRATEIQIWLMAYHCGPRIICGVQLNSKDNLEDQNVFRDSIRWDKLGPECSRSRSASDVEILSQKKRGENHKNEWRKRNLKTEHVTIQPIHKNSSVTPEKENPRRGMAPGAQNVYGDPTELQQNTWGIDNKTHEIKQTARKTSLHRSYTEVRSQQEAARRKGEFFFFPIYPFSKMESFEYLAGKIRRLSAQATEKCDRQPNNWQLKNISPYPDNWIPSKAIVGKNRLAEWCHRNPSPVND